MKKWFGKIWKNIREAPLRLAVFAGASLMLVDAGKAASTNSGESSFFDSSTYDKFVTTTSEVQTIIEIAVGVVMILVVTYAVVNYLSRFVNRSS